MTLALAIIGTVTGGLALIVDLLRYRRERPNLVVTANVQATLGAVPLVTIEVANRGHEATTIVKAALQDQSEVELADDGTVFAKAKIEQDLTRGALTVISPGEVARFGLSLNTWPDLVHIDAAVRPYVVDAHGRTTWGPAFPMMRFAVHPGGMRPAQDVNPELLQSPGGVITPPPLEPRWKVWKPRHLRRPLPFREFPPIDLTKP